MMAWSAFLPDIEVPKGKLLHLPLHVLWTINNIPVLVTSIIFHLNGLRKQNTLSAKFIQKFELEDFTTLSAFNKNKKVSAVHLFAETCHAKNGSFEKSIFSHFQKYKMFPIYFCSKRKSFFIVTQWLPTLYLIFVSFYSLLKFIVWGFSIFFVSENEG